MLPCLPSAPLLLRHSALKCCPAAFRPFLLRHSALKCCPVCLPPLFATALCPQMLPCLPSAPFCYGTLPLNAALFAFRPFLLRHSALKLPCCPSPFCKSRNAPVALLLSVPFLQSRNAPVALLLSVPFLQSRNAPVALFLLAFRSHKLALCPWLSLLLPSVP